MDSVSLADTVAANSGALIDFARVSVPFGEKMVVNGWIATGIGAFVVISCLTIIIFAISMVPIVLSWFNKYFPENSIEKEVKPNTPAASVEAAAAAAIAVSYHNYHNN